MSEIAAPLSSVENCEIISSEILVIPSEDHLKVEVHNERGNLMQLAEDVTDSLVDNIDAMAGKIHDIILGSPDQEPKEDLPIFSEQVQNNQQKSLDHQHDATYNLAHQTLKDFHMREQFNYLPQMTRPSKNLEMELHHNLNPELTIQGVNFSKAVQIYEDRFLYRSKFPMTFDLSHIQLEKETKIQKQDFKRVRKVRPLPENWRRPQRKLASVNLDQILSQEEVKEEHLRLQQEALCGHITQVAPEILTSCIMQHDTKFQPYFIPGEHTDEFRTPPQLKIQEINNLVEGQTIDVRDIDFLRVKEQLRPKHLYRKFTGDSNTQTKTIIRQNPYQRSHKLTQKEKLLLIEKKKVINSLRPPKLPYLGSLRRQNQYLFQREQQVNSENNHNLDQFNERQSIPDLGISLRHGYLEENQLNQNFKKVKKILEQDAINENKPEKPAKPSNYVGMFQ